MANRSINKAAEKQGPVSGPDTPAIVPLTPKVVTVDPVSRIEGHLKVEVKIDHVGGSLEVVDAWVTGALFRGIEKILENRHPWDAVPITQRICGVCPVSHGLAAAMANDEASGVVVPENGRILRNIVLAASYVSDHILHFYHLALLDFIVGPDMQPWEVAWKADMRPDAATTQQLVQSYLKALEMRRKAHEAGAVFGGRMPSPPAYVPGGFTARPTTDRIQTVSDYMDELIPFVQNTYIPDVQLLGTLYNDFYNIGRGPGNLLAFGVFDLDATGTNKFMPRGQVLNGSTTVQPVDIGRITEDVTTSWYDNATNGLPPASGDTVPQFPKTDAYSWLKAPRYSGQPYEVGPLARMWMSGDYQSGISVMDRHMARAMEAEKVAHVIKTWLGELTVNQTSYQNHNPPGSGTGVGLTEAARGALGHWLGIQGGKVDHYQVITPTCWNASPRDTNGVMGTMEQALIGTPVKQIVEPIEVMRVVHSFDPCLACAVHVSRPGGKDVVVVRTR